MISYEVVYYTHILCTLTVWCNEHASRYRCLNTSSFSGSFIFSCGYHFSLFFFFCLVVLFCECLRIIYNFPFCFYVVCVLHAVIYCCARKRTLNDVLVFRTHMHNECDTRLNCVEMSVYHLLYCMKILRTFITGLLRMHNRKCHVFWWNEIRFYWLRRFYSHLNASFAVIRIHRCGIIRNGNFPCNMIQLLNQ